MRGEMRGERKRRGEERRGEEGRGGRRGVYLFGSDSERSHQPSLAVGASGLVVCVTATPVGHDHLIIEQALAGGTLGTRGQLHMQLGSL